jgi:hypothetical protein
MLFDPWDRIPHVPDVSEHGCSVVSCVSPVPSPLISLCGITLKLEFSNAESGVFKIY